MEGRKRKMPAQEIRNPVPAIRDRQTEKNTVPPRLLNGLIHITDYP